MNHNDYKISIIVNCRNGEKFLKESLDSIFVQDFDNFEVIFFDNLSNDNSKQIASKYDDRLKIINSSKSLSLGEARLSALNEISGDLFCFLDTDDKMLPNRLKIQSKELIKSKSLWSFGSYRKIDENGKTIKTVLLKPESKDIFESLLLRYSVNFQSLMFKKEVFDVIDPFFNPALTFSPDYNLVMKLSLIESPLIIKTPLIEYRIHKESLTSNSKKIAEEYKITLEELRTIIDPNSFYQISINVALKKYHWYRALEHVKQGRIKEARKELIFTNFFSYKYFLFYLLLWLPGSQKIFLKFYDFFRN